MVGREQVCDRVEWGVWIRSPGAAEVVVEEVLVDELAVAVRLAPGDENRRRLPNARVLQLRHRGRRRVEQIRARPRARGDARQRRATGGSGRLRSDRQGDSGQRADDRRRIEQGVQPQTREILRPGELGRKARPRNDCLDPREARRGDDRNGDEGAARHDMRRTRIRVVGAARMSSSWLIGAEALERLLRLVWGGSAVRLLELRCGFCF